MTRFAAIAAVIGLLVSGIAIGALGTYIVMDRRPPHDGGPGRMPPFLDELQRRLDLTPEQRTKITAILDESWRAGEAIRKEFKPRIEQQIESTRTRIAEVLTPAQREKFEALNREQRHRAERFMLEGHGRPFPPPWEAGPPPPRDGGPPRP